MKLVAALTLLILSVSQQVFAEKWQQPEFIQQAFYEIALKNEYRDYGTHIRKWNKPIKVWLDHQVADETLHTDLARMHLNHLQQITGHSIALVEEKREANLVVMFTRQSEWPHQVKQMFGEKAAAVIKGAVCMANFQINGSYEIVKAGVIIPVDQARMHGKLVSCVVEELTQVMGLPNDSEKVFPSIFNDHTPEQLLSGLDYLLLKLLYRPEVKSGMSKQQVTPVIKKIIRQWQQQGTIRSSSKQVRQGELYPLLGY